MLKSARGDLCYDILSYLLLSVDILDKVKAIYHWNVGHTVEYSLVFLCLPIQFPYCGAEPHYRILACLLHGPASVCFILARKEGAPVFYS